MFAYVCLWMIILLEKTGDEQVTEILWYLSLAQLVCDVTNQCDSVWILKPQWTECGVTDGLTVRCTAHHRLLPTCCYFRTASTDRPAGGGSLPK